VGFGASRVMKVRSDWVGFSKLLKEAFSVLDEEISASESTGGPLMHPESSEIDRKKNRTIR
jgi:hypothetical protein